MYFIAIDFVILNVYIHAVFCDPCASRPCLNAGICTSTNGITFECKCPRLFFGERCEKMNDACEKHSCQNGALCRADVHGDYHCECKTGYRGIFCEIDHDDCLPSPCYNSASCKDKVNDYECVCVEPGTFGKKCELRESDIRMFVSECSVDSVCWRNYTKTLTIPWGYGENICNTQQSCFGKKNSSDKREHLDYFIDVQLHPVQMQLGDVLNFTSDNSIQTTVSGVTPQLIPVDVYNDSISFVNCNTTNGTQLVTSPQHHIIINDTNLLHVGVHYFIMNIDVTYRCDFGLRLNISVKEHDCLHPESGMMCSNRGQCHTNFGLPHYQCLCYNGFRGKYCEKRDHCFDNPCQNQSVCINVEKKMGGEDYQCRCKPGYEGKHCNLLKNMCINHPCQNDALCHSLINTYYCQCKSGYMGHDCSINVNECSTLEPCENNASCVNGDGDYFCVCPSGFTGTNCEVNINECASSPCKRGMCIDGTNSYHCLCPAQFTGFDCDIPLRECASQPCLNGGVCTTKGTSYHCQCGLGYEGDNCEKDVDLCSKHEACSNFHSCIDKGSRVLCVCKPGFTGSNCGVNINECASQPCKFGGKCQDKEDGYKCMCLPGYNGGICDQVNDTFHDPSRLHLRFSTKDCFSIENNPNILNDFKKNVAANIRNSCECQFSENHIHNHSTSIKCHNRLTGSFYSRIEGIEGYTAEKLICNYQQYLMTRSKAVSLGNDTVETDVVYNSKRCAQINGIHNQIPDAVNGGTIALTVGLVVSLLGLFIASVVVFLKWRKKAGLSKNKKSDDKNLVDAISLNSFSSTTPTPKSMYRNCRGAQRNYACTHHNLDPVQIRSKRV